MSNVPHIPEHCNTLNFYFIVDDGKAALDFYVNTFDGEQGHLMEGPDGSVMHASVNIGNSCLMLSGACPQWGTKSAKTLGGSPASIHLYVKDADKAFDKAVAAGCTVVSPMMDCFWGERMGKVEDPFGLQWGIATQTEIVSEEQMEERAAEWMAQMAAGQPETAKAD